MYLRIYPHSYLRIYLQDLTTRLKSVYILCSTWNNELRFFILMTTCSTWNIRRMYKIGLRMSYLYLFELFHAEQLTIKTPLFPPYLSAKCTIHKEFYSFHRPFASPILPFLPLNCSLRVQKPKVQNPKSSNQVPPQYKLLL
jgi:hypothetical protein